MCGKGNDCSLHVKAYLNSLMYDSQYMYFLSFEYHCKIRHKTLSIKFSKLDDLRGANLSGLSEQS